MDRGKKGDYGFMFRDDFVWGVASSAYQIEGRDADDGYGKMIWDTFTEEGHILDGQSAATACDNIHRYREDYALMRLLGIKAYRFSVSWARLMPDGTGRVNEKAIALYRDMIMEMKKNGIEPYLTMYHWELPQALQDRGGWLNEEIIQWFGEYAKVIAENFSDLCEYYFTLNEPQCFVGLGHLAGVHAPGKKMTYAETFQIAHNALRSHGQAVINLRKYAKRPVKIGYAPTCGMAYPETESEADIEAARKALFSFGNSMDNWTWNVAWFSDPVFLGRYPEEGLKKFKEYLPVITDEDMKLIAQPLDFMGQNIYNGYAVRAGKDGEPEYVERKPGHPKTAANWPVTPECFYWGVKFLYERYQKPLYITENGMSCHDIVSSDGQVHDPNRIEFLDLYLSALQRANDDGADVRGYFLWTFLDNFEWDKGYTERFGIVHVDFTTQKRIAKDSAFWYQDVIRTNGRSLTVNNKKHPLLFISPVFKQTIWGGERLGSEWNYQIPGSHTGECWSVSAHPNGDCLIKEGEYAGYRLSELWKVKPELFGNKTADGFPLLVKIIDAKEDLSVQVHPDDGYAKKEENGASGKTECWYVLDCKEDSALIIGHHAKTKEEFGAMAKAGKWKELLREIPVQKGDFIQNEPGTLHAVKGGIMLLEIQQSSDITYRVYDYDRLENGRARELHFEKGMDVIAIPSASVESNMVKTQNLPKNKMNLLISCDYYNVWKLDITERFCMKQEQPFLIMNVIEGDGLLNGQMIRKGDNLILPCGYGDICLQGDMQIIVSACHS
ncbi:MAG: GH1 family beta-glucosidase [Bacillus sp. (in: Bacteria)]|nr:GH1 family beta-glucosidase [Bacillus sp. (in: firmicutes)]MCM1426089.1 GH1 family beta-glucosidase [Eubacterium sp.]